jgi:DtxR family transcriptional regulator, Mn-dependent transcriptional regulator
MSRGPGKRAATPVGTLSESLEDYLEIILQLQQEKRVARVRDIAARKGVSNASVSNALTRLARDGFVLHEAHEFVELTDRGAELARRVLRRHEFLVAFLHDVLQVSPETAEQDACAVEHQVSAETLGKLASFYQFVRSCPKAGNAFLDAFRSCCASGYPDPHSPQNPDCGSCSLMGGHRREAQQQQVVPLSTLHPGDSGEVVRLSLPSPGRERLADSGILPNVLIEVTRSAPQGGMLRVSVQGCQMDLDPREASGILVRRQ